MWQYLGGLLEERHGRPGEDLLTRLANDDGPDGRMTDEEIIATVNLLLIAGHETTVNLITNGMLTLLRHPPVLRRLRDDPDLVVPLVEELLRYEPPVHIFRWRAAYSDISVDGTVIPKGSRILLMPASGSRDPKRFRDPDRFDPDRRDDRHLGFGSGIHLCFGGPLARRETQIALVELVRRLEEPRLVADPPPQPGAARPGPPAHRAGRGLTPPHGSRHAGPGPGGVAAGAARAKPWSARTRSRWAAGSDRIACASSATVVSRQTDFMWSDSSSPRRSGKGRLKVGGRKGRNEGPGR